MQQNQVSIVPLGSQKSEYYVGIGLVGSTEDEWKNTITWSGAKSLFVRN